MATAEKSLNHGAARFAAEPAGAAHVPPFARVLIELLAKRWNGTLLIRAEDGENEAAVRFADGFAVAAKVGAPSATLLQCLIPLCVWVHKRFEFIDREDAVGEDEGVVTGQVDPLGLIAAAVRGPVREEVLEEAMAALGTEPFRLRTTTVLARYGFTSQELHAVAWLQRGPIDIKELRAQAQVPEHALRRVIYVLWVTHALTLVASPRRLVSGTIRNAAPPPSTNSRSGQEMSPLELPPVPSAPVELLSEVTVEIHNPDAFARASSVPPVPSMPPVRTPLQSDVAPTARGRYHVQNPNNGVSAVDARVRSIPPVIDALLRATNRPRPSSSPSNRSLAPSARNAISTEGRSATPPMPRNATMPERRSGTPPMPRNAVIPEARSGTPPMPRNATFIEGSGEPPASEVASPEARCEPPAIGSETLPEAANPTRSLKPIRQSPLTRSLKPVRPSAQPANEVEPELGGKPTRSLKPVATSSRPPVIEATRSSAPPRVSGRHPSGAGTHQREEGDVRATTAEGLMRRGDYAAAVVEMQAAMKLRGPRATDEALYAWMLCQQHAMPREVPEAAWNALERAFRLDLHSDVAYHYKAMMMKREGRLAEARAHFRRALHLNPRNVDARRELRVLLMRKRDGDRPSSQGILNRLFGRTPVPR